MAKKANPYLPMFVYGTLRKGRANHERLFGGIVKVVKKAKLEGAEMYMIPSGAFPLIQQGEGRIEGELIYVHEDDFEYILQRVDHLEGYNERNRKGSMYVREIVSVMHKENGGGTMAYAYFWNQEISHLFKRIDSGDFNKEVV